MKLKTSSSIVPFILFLAVSCTPTKNNEATVESTQNQVTDTLAIQAEETTITAKTSQTLIEDNTAEPFSGLTDNFPGFWMGVLTNDSLAADINSRIAKLIQIYDTIPYDKITSSYSWERAFYAQAQDGPGTMSTETESETKTWFFDQYNRLRAFSMEIEMESDFPSRKSILYLFSNDSLIAVNVQAVDESEVTVNYQTRMLASQCPNCGVAVVDESMAESGAGAARYLGETDLAAMQKEFNESMTELISILKAGQKKAKEDGDYLIFSVNQAKEGNAEDRSKAITYPVEYRVTPSLYPNYISKQ